MFSERLRQARQAKRHQNGKRWTQRDLASAIGANPNTVNGWENRGVVPPGPTRHAIAHALGVRLSWLEGSGGKTGQKNALIDASSTNEDNAAFRSYAENVRSLEQTVNTMPAGPIGRALRLEFMHQLQSRATELSIVLPSEFWILLADIQSQ